MHGEDPFDHLVVADTPSHGLLAGRALGFVKKKLVLVRRLPSALFAFKVEKVLALFVQSETGPRFADFLAHWALVRQVRVGHFLRSSEYLF